MALGLIKAWPGMVGDASDAFKSQNGKTIMIFSMLEKSAEPFGTVGI